MKNPFCTGDTKKFERIVRPVDSAAFDSGELHPVYATFALGRDAEWACRLFVLEMKEENEEGIGTYLNIIHHSPALVGQKVEFSAVLKEVNGHEVIATFVAKVGECLVASGETGQKILKKEKLRQIFTKLV